MATILIGCAVFERESPIPVGGYQTFTGTLDDGSRFVAQAWLDSRTGGRSFCAKVRSRETTTLCTGAYSTADVLDVEPIEFLCADQRRGNAVSIRGPVGDDVYTYAVDVLMEDGASGRGVGTAPRPWFGEDLCSD